MYRNCVKRLLDILIALIGLPVFLLLLLVVGPVIYLTDKGPIFYNAPRLGKDGKIFKMYKFRSMYVNAPDIRNADGSTFNSEDDPRVTKIGRIMRKTSLDEIPQILNVLRGEMSLIGPRPNLVIPYEELTDVEKRRLAVRPGITGYNQAYFRNSVSTEEKYEHDLYYVETVSFLFDVKILIQTVIAVLKRENINHTPSASDETEASAVK